MFTQRKHKKHTSWFASPRVAPLFAILFLCAQFLASAHAATYGDSDHVHDGKPCIIAAAHKQTDNFDIASPPPIPERTLDHTLVTAALDTSAFETGATTHTIRGPPARS